MLEWKWEVRVNKREEKVERWVFWVGLWMGFGIRRRGISLHFGLQDFNFGRAEEEGGGFGVNSQWLNCCEN